MNLFEFALIVFLAYVILFVIIDYMMRPRKEIEATEKNYNAEADRLLDLDEHEKSIS